jgi:Holliday junction DNA helicase RuvA
MIAHLEGTIKKKSSTEAVIDCSGVGYSVMISLFTSEWLGSVGEKATLLTVLIPREDAWNLYGFRDEEERKLFRLLLSVSGIGGKIALGILSSIEANAFAEEVLSGNITALTKLPGIGKKTAERLHLELKDKIADVLTIDSGSIGMGSNQIKNEGVSALVALGYTQSAAEKFVQKAMKEMPGGTHSAEDLIKLSLKIAMK